MSPKHLNILYMHGDGAARFIQPYGYAVPTPHLQRLAEEGVLFRNAFSAAPTCSPSRAALLTGSSPHANGVNGLTPHGHTFSDPDQTLPHRLRALGYHTVMDAPPCFVQLDYDRWIIPANHAEMRGNLNGRTYAVADAACDFLQTYDGAAPFFLNVGFGPPKGRAEAHPPDGTSPTDPRFVRPPDCWPDTPAVRRDWARQIDATRLMDDAMGRVLGALEAGGWAANTLVICTPDHGPAGPAMKSCLTDAGQGVFLLMRGPDGFAGGKVIEPLVSQIDIVPTVFDLLGAPCPEHVEGVSLLPLVRGEVERVRDEVFGELTYHWAYKPVRTIRTERYRYVRRFYNDPNLDLANEMNTPAKQRLAALGAYVEPPPQEALYDLARDPHQVCNRIDETALAAVADDLRRRLDRWMRETKDPLLAGPVPLPAAGETNPPEDPWREGPQFPLTADAWNQRLQATA